LGFEVVVVEEFDVGVVVALVVVVVVEVALGVVVEFDAGFDVELDVGFPVECDPGLADGVDVDADEVPDVVCPRRFKTAIEEMTKNAITIFLMGSLPQIQEQFVGR